MRKPDFRLCEKKGADQMCSNCTVDQLPCFRYTDSTIPLVPKSEISSSLSFSLTAQTGLCQALSETQKTGFLELRLICLFLKKIYCSLSLLCFTICLFLKKIYQF